jgi:CRISPR-associated endonuclease/helicase Cas3
MSRLRTFDILFASLTGNQPFPWQCALYERFIDGGFPSTCGLPTGLGKTAVIPIWLLALAEAPSVVPRRLVYVVNRRTVVDQATDEAEKIRKAVAIISELESALRNLCSVPLKPDEQPLAISTLRGQFADNTEWRLDPARPAIIVGTVDMIGSRLLFSGYRCGFRSRPLHAGFLGQDALLVHDEAHLEPAFQKLLLRIVEEQRRCGEFRKFHAMELSATSRGTSKPFELSPEDRDNEVIKQRLRAKKRIVLNENTDERKVAEQMAELALAHRDSGQAILIYGRYVEDVEKIAARLRKEKLPHRVLTGTMRGRERDRLAEADDVFARFLPKPPDSMNDGTVYLICTSAGEVGVNISADHLVCDLSPFDSMAQRFGRVNRFGNGKAQIDIVTPTEFEDDAFNQSRKATLRLLERLDGDGSPAALGKLPLEDRLAAFTPEPDMLPATDILFDAWALTSIDDLPGRPPVADYLHGIAEWEPPVTYVAWRMEVEWLGSGNSMQLDPGSLLFDYPLKPHELLKDRYDRVFKRLQRLAEAHPGAPVWVLNDDVEPITLATLVTRDKEVLAEATVLLPPRVGGLSETGMLDDTPGDPNLDVADEWYTDHNPPRRRRLRLLADDPNLAEKTQGMRLVHTLVLGGTDDEDEPGEETPAPREWRWYVRPKSADDDGSKTSTKAIRLADHNRGVGNLAARIAEALELPEAIRSALIFAARHHDDGKGREQWQRSIGNSNGAEPMAKSGHRRPPQLHLDYRHEFGSILDVAKTAEFLAHAPEAQDLALHLIAAHHGRGRPHFTPKEAFDPRHPESTSAAVVREVPSIYARLQKRYGRWGLAYLESLLRAADWAASANPEGCE